MQFKELFFFLNSKDNKADVILKYNADEARSLKAYGELPEHGDITYCIIDIIVVI